VTDVQIRPITVDDDFEAQLDLGQRAFGIYSPGQRDSWLHVARLRAGQGMFLGAFVGGTPAGGAILHDMRQYWLGNAVPCGGVASVKVAPEYRGSGIGRRLMTTLLDLIADRGYPLSALYPATMPIYRSLGWELVGAKYEMSIPARSLRSLLAADPFAASAGGTGAGVGGAGVGGAGVAMGHAGAAHGGEDIRRAGPQDVRTMTGVIGRCHELARDAGPVTWDEGPAAKWLARADLYSYLAGDDGFTAYRWIDGHDLWVERMHATTPEALRALWSVVASHSSVAERVRGLIAPADPIWWLTREHDVAITDRSMWMLRVVDAPAAIAARGFPTAVFVSVPLVINDHLRPANSGNWHLTVADGKAQLTADTRPASTSSSPLTLGARGFAALYAGVPLRVLRLSGLAAGGSADSDAALTAAFAATPYMLDDF
jgi:predicted acetyltransferase